MRSVIPGPDGKSDIRIFDHGADGEMIDKTWEKGAAEISLDATASGRPLYESMGFTGSTEYMVLTKPGFIGV